MLVDSINTGRHVRLLIAPLILLHLAATLGATSERRVLRVHPGLAVRNHLLKPLSCDLRRILSSIQRPRVRSRLLVLFVPVDAVWIWALHKDLGQCLRTMWLTRNLWRVYNIHRPQLIWYRREAFSSCGRIEHLSRDE